MAPKRKTAKPEEWAAKLGTNSLNPIMAMDLQEAVRAHKTSAKLDGRLFRIKYLPDRETVYYCPADDSFSPAGTLNIKRFLDNI